MKKQSSLLGQYYLEIEPGTATTVTAAGERIAHTLLGHGDEIATGH